MLLVQTGGTIDKDYPRNFGGYAFEIADSAAARVIKAHAPHLELHVVSVCKKDSSEMNQDDRLAVLEAVRNTKHTQILITHGTDTLLETGQFLQTSLQAQDKVVVLTGSLRPERFKDSDASFNVGMAVGALCSLSAGIYVAMHGTVCSVGDCERDQTTGSFVCKGGQKRNETTITQQQQQAPQHHNTTTTPPSTAMLSRTKWCKQDNSGFVKLEGAKWNEFDNSGKKFASFDFVGEGLHANNAVIVLFDDARKLGIMLTPTEMLWRTHNSSQWSLVCPGGWANVTDPAPGLPTIPENPAQKPALEQSVVESLAARGLPSCVTARNFAGEEGTYVPFVGEKVCFLVHVSHLLDEKTPAVEKDKMAGLVAAFDRIFSWYATACGSEPPKHLEYQGRLPIICVLGKSQIGACCGYVGVTGIEMSDWCWEYMYKQWHEHGRIDQALPYEFGRNFLFTDIRAKLNYHAPDSDHTVSTGFAVFMRFRAIEECEFEGAHFRGKDYKTFLEHVRALVPFCLSKGATWDTTLRVGQCPENEMGLSVCDLWAAFMLVLCDKAGSGFVPKFFEFLRQREDAHTTQDAVDNVVICASLAAGQNLVNLFQEWTWPVSDKAVALVVELVGGTV